MSSGEALEPLQKLLESLQVRLAAVESHVGIQVQERPSSVGGVVATNASSSHKRVSSTSSSSYSGVFQKAIEEEPKLEKEKDETLSRSLIAFDTLVASSLLPLLDSLTALTLTELTAPLSEIWTTQRVIIQMAASCKKPSGMTLTEALQSHLIPIQSSMKTIQTLFATDKKYRSFDIHGKAIQELLVGVSWLVMQPPPAPSSHVKETLSSTDFWTNKIRKEYKALASSSDADVLAKKQMAFCDAIKKLILEMATYVKEYHLSGLCWNPNGVHMRDYVAPTNTTPSGNKSIQEQQDDQPKPVEASSSTTSQGNWIKELESKQTLDGNSAATGLRKVTKDQQTWRKEYVAPTAISTTTSVSATKMKFESSSSSSSPLANSTTPTQKSVSTTAKTGGKDGKEGLPPICEYQASGNKWVIENQNSCNNSNGLCTIEVQDAKTQAYIFNCNQVTIQIRGKLKSIILDSCIKTNVLFESTISSCETVNSKKVQIQCTGTCPTFTIDKTDGCLVFLSQESLEISQFVTSKSSEMNIEWQDEKTGEIKECPIPEQFVHRWNQGDGVTSSVSDIYH